MLPSITVLWSFALVVAVLTVTPGLDTALVLRSAALGGRRRAWGVIAGIQTGTMAWGVLAAAGVSAILIASEVAYDVLRFVGAAYLVYIGGRMLWSAIRGNTSHGAEQPTTGTTDSFLGGWRQGTMTNLLNPKMGAFYVALLPQFIPAGAPQITWGIALAGVHVVLGAVWLTLLTLVAQRFRAWLSKRRVARTIDGVAGIAIVGFGARIALEGTSR
ncbi:LysE family translocator [Curtobacterium pusillum]|uniref:LysE family translocator n=1 Tax=Curtobacterium pusillum TaxID=69373 RepID=UPI001C2F58DD|nr:LysE family translocator [Curtobacterium pusillum]GLK30580.1 threonine transporter RhtB [Curtobacterium pusillum]